MRFNINDFVTTKLTPHGLHIYASSSYYNKSRITTDGVLCEQAWIVMRVFGSRLSCGSEQVFVDNVWTVESSVEPVSG